MLHFYVAWSILKGIKHQSWSKEVQEEERDKVPDICRTGKGCKVTSEALGLQRKRVRANKRRKRGAVVDLTTSGRPKDTPKTHQWFIHRELQASLVHNNVTVHNPAARKSLDKMAFLKEVQDKKNNNSQTEIQSHISHLGKKEKEKRSIFKIPKKYLSKHFVDGKWQTIKFWKVWFLLHLFKVDTPFHFNGTQCTEINEMHYISCDKVRSKIVCSKALLYNANVFSFVYTHLLSCYIQKHRVAFYD